MFQQIDNDNFESDSSVLKNRDSTLNSQKDSIDTEPNTVSSAVFVEKKSVSERWKTNRFWLIKALYYLLHTIWVIVMIVGGFIAWLISLLFI